MNEVIYSVSELNLMIKSLLEGDRTFTNIQIQGEISNFKVILQGIVILLERCRRRTESSYVSQSGAQSAI